jgi:phosphatidylethanolamine-binding protein (PEBP) family uncharacterized protein
MLNTSRFAKATAFGFLVVSSTFAFSQEFSMDWNWKLEHKCSEVSPAIELSNVPKDTHTFVVALVDFDMRSFDHGGGVVAHNGESKFSIPAGALKTYRGPCPPNFSSFGHDYEFSVAAVGLDGKSIISRVSKVKTFSQKTVSP